MSFVTKDAFHAEEWEEEWEGWAEGWEGWEEGWEEGCEGLRVLSRSLCIHILATVMTGTCSGCGDGNSWRACSGVWSSSSDVGDQKAVTYNIVRPFGDTFAKGPMVDNSVPADCSTWHGTLGEAKVRCSADPHCHMLHDHNSDGQSWRHCAGYMKAGGDDSDGLNSSRSRLLNPLVQRVLKPLVQRFLKQFCHRTACVESVTEKAATYIIHRPSVDQFVKGPNVDNGAYHSAGCWNWHGSFGEAKAKCHAEPTCTTLHDMNGDGNAWRYMDACTISANNDYKRMTAKACGTLLPVCLTSVGEGFCAGFKDLTSMLPSNPTASDCYHLVQDDSECIHKDTISWGKEGGARQHMCRKASRK
eukprot:gene57111-biopygen107252